MTTSINIIIAASVVGFEVLLLLIIFGILLYRRYVQKRSQEQGQGQNSSGNPDNPTNLNPHNMNQTSQSATDETRPQGSSFDQHEMRQPGLSKKISFKSTMKNSFKNDGNLVNFIRGAQILTKELLRLACTTLTKHTSYK